MRVNIKKQKAISLRQRGKSYREIEKILDVSRSTLNGWLANVALSSEQENRLYQKCMDGLKKARAKASIAHINARIARSDKIRREARAFLDKISFNEQLCELIFSTFYLAEGSKKENAVIVANSNPILLKAIVALFRNIYDVDQNKFRCCLHLRSDQSEVKLKNFWSKLLDIPKGQFIKTQFDHRAIKESYKDYKGVCVVTYFDISLQRRILYIGDYLLEKLIKIKAGL